MTSIRRVQAIRYARHERKAAENFLGGDDHQTDMPLDYYVWAIHRDGGAPIVVDTGFDEETARRRGRTIIRPVADGLREAGVEPDLVEDVIITHMHYDHSGNLGLFPRARFHVQEVEMAFCTGRAMTHAHVRAPFDVEPVLEMVRHVFAERVVFHAGPAGIDFDILMHKVGGHSAGLQVVEVETARGPVMLASDAAHLYANLIRRIPFPIVVDVPAYLDALDQICGIAGSVGSIVPGHDPLVLELFPPEPGTTDIARVDLPPVKSLEDIA